MRKMGHEPFGSRFAAVSSFGREEIAAEFRKACHSEIATAVEVAASRLVRDLQHGLVVVDTPRKATRNRPEL
jgi:hypothetical protein